MGAKKCGGKVSRGLAEQEIYGNMFFYNFAERDTTATTFNWAIYLLAAFREVQDWVAEKINALIPNDAMTTWNYSELFPKLNCCQAVLVCPPSHNYHPRKKEK